MFTRFIIMVILIALGVYLWQNFNPADFSKENIEAKIKKEKTINTVQKAREKQREAEQRAIDKF